MRRLVILALIVLSAAVVTACQPAVTTPTGYKPLLTGLVDKGSETAYPVSYTHLTLPTILRV